MDNAKNPATINGILTNGIADNALYASEEWRKHGPFFLGITGDTIKEIGQDEHQTYSSAYANTRSIGYPKNSFIFPSDKFEIEIPNYISQALIILTATIEVGTANPSRGRFIRINQADSNIGGSSVLVRGNGVDFERYSLSAMAVATNRFANEDETEFANKFTGLYNLCEGDKILGMGMTVIVSNYY